MLNSFVFLLVFLISAMSAADALIFTSNLNRNINREIKYFEDVTGLSSSEAKDKLLEFKAIASQNVVLDFKETNTWIELSVSNANSTPEKMYLTFSPAYLGNIELYSKENKLEYVAGSLHKTPDDLIFFSQVLPVSLTAGQNNKLIKIKLCSRAYHNVRWITN